MSFPAIQKTLILITEIESKVHHRDLRHHFKTLLKSVQDSIKEIECYLQVAQYNCYKNKIKLCISQMLKVIPALIHLLSDGNLTAFEDIADYMLEKLRWCLMEPMRIFSGGGIEEDTESSGMFVRSIDWAISILQAGEPVDENYKLAVDDLLCQALTIAKLAAGQDYNEISSGCRSVLVSLSSVLDSKETLETAKRLHRDILLCNLETLYRRINTAVLRLFLYVMSDSFLPLKNIVVKCVENCAQSSEVKKRRPSDLDQLITNLDLYLEQLILLGNFAVACTDSWDTKLKVQCCLASLEFCEKHLVPTVTSFYLDQRSSRRSYLSFLTDEAQKTLKELHIQINNIVDTGSFARVVFEDLTDLTRTIRENISDGIFEKRECELFQRRCNKLVQHLLITDDKYVRQDHTVHQVVKQLLTVLKNQGDRLQNGSPTINHIIWDLDLALELLDCLCQKLNFSALNHSSVGRISIDRSAASFPDSVRNLPLDASTPRVDKNITIISRDGQAWLNKFRNSNNKEGERHNGCDVSSTLEPYLSRIGETPVLQSTLYCRTPLKTLRNLRNDNTTFDFTDILDELSKLPKDTLVSYKDETSSRKDQLINNLKDAMSRQDDHNTSNIPKPRNTLSESNNTLSDIYNIGGAERLRDIKFVENRITQLKEN